MGCKAHKGKSVQMNSFCDRLLQNNLATVTIGEITVDYNFEVCGQSAPALTSKTL